MLDKTINKYINIVENGKAGQDPRTKEWYCKEIPFKDAPDLDNKISEINKVTNKYNDEMRKEQEPAKIPQRKRKPKDKTEDKTEDKKKNEPANKTLTKGLD